MFLLTNKLTLGFKELQETPGQPNRNSLQYPVGPASRSPSPSVRSISPHQSFEYRRPYQDTVTNTLAPPPTVPHGPRSPGQFSMYSRTPSPKTTNTEHQETNGTYPVDSTASISPVSHDSDTDADVPTQPSAKALGKQKAVDIDLSDCTYHVLLNVLPQLTVSSIFPSHRGRQLLRSLSK